MKKTKQNSHHDDAISELIEVARKYPTTPMASSTLDLRVTMGDLRTMATVELRRGIDVARAEITRQIEQRQKDIEARSEELIALGNQEIEAYTTNQEIGEIVAALNKWAKYIHQAQPRNSCDSYRCLFVSATSGIYGGYENDSYADETARPKIDADRGEIVGELRLLTARNRVDELDCPVTLPFTPAMTAIQLDIRRIQAEIQELAGELGRCNRQIAELANQGDAIQSLLTRAHLSGELKEAGDILRVLEGCCKRLNLPLHPDFSTTKQLTHEPTRSH